MPYIKLKDRDLLKPETVIPDNAGGLNYQITCLIQDYFNFHGQNYQTANDIVGAVEGAKLEFYRRVVAPYEDFKIEENGDVY